MEQTTCFSYFTVLKETINDSYTSFFGHRPKQVNCPVTLLLLAKALEKNRVGDHIGHAPKLRHPAEQDVESLIRPVSIAQTSEEASACDDIDAQACSEEASEECKRKVRDVRAAAAVNEYVVGARRG
nr:unnamed protein product [Digitaria exilis]